MADCSTVIAAIKPSIAVVIGKGGHGTGFVFQQKGVLVTCNHVVEQDTSARLRFPGESTFIEATVVVRDIEHDLALLKFSDTARAPLEQIEEGSVAEGMPVLFSGYPFQFLAHITHQGIVSGVTTGETGITSYLIDATVNAGNSGGPLFTEEGKVVGVVNARWRQDNEFLEGVEEMQEGAISLHGVDLVKIHKAILGNAQVGMGFAVPITYVPRYRAGKKETKT